MLNKLLVLILEYYEKEGRKEKKASYTSRFRHGSGGGEELKRARSPFRNHEKKFFFSISMQLLAI